MKLNKKKMGFVIALVFFLLFSITVFALENRIFGYKDAQEWSTDRRIKQYQSLPENTVDVLVMGSSHMMSGVNTPLLWKESGMTAYNYVSRNQTVPFTYLMLKEALKTQHPKLVIFDISILINPSDYYDVVYDEYHAHINFDLLPLTTEKIKMLNDFLPVKEQLNFYLPFLRFHTRWKELSKTDFGIEDEEGKAPIYNGFSIVTELVNENVENPVDISKEGYEITDLPVQMSDKWQDYFDKMMKLCKEEQVEVLFLDIPNSQNILWEDSEYPYLNGNAIAEEIHFDEKKYALDETHINIYGSIAFTKYLNQYLLEHYSLKDHRGEEGYEVYETSYGLYEEDMSQQGIYEQ